MLSTTFLEQNWQQWLAALWIANPVFLYSVQNTQTFYSMNQIICDRHGLFYEVRGDHDSRADFCHRIPLVWYSELLFSRDLR